MKGLRGVTKHNQEALTRLHDDLFSVCIDLLQRDRYFILEDAVIRAGKRKQRDEIQWKVIVARIEEQLGYPLAAHHRASLRRMTKVDENPLKATKDVVKALTDGNGNETAGYGFLGWPDRQTTERQIEARHHVADGINQSANRLKTSLETIEPLKLQ